MTRDQIESWSTYFVGQMQEERGVSSHEAEKIVGSWLQSLGQPTSNRARRHDRPLVSAANPSAD